jgi:protein-disulfide isomerase
MADSRFCKMLVVITATLLIGISVFVLVFDRSHLPLAISLQTKGQPTIGYPKATVHVVVFEEPKCPQCKQFTNSIFPQLKKDFIDTNKILYTIIPVSFLPNSMPAAIAWLCVFNQEKNYPDKELFFKYVEYMYAHQPSESEDWATNANLEKYAKEVSPAIQLNVLKGCVDTEGYRVQIEKNTKYGMQIMDGELSTPTLYVNGVRLDDISYRSLSQLIHERLRHRGEQL